MGTRTMNHQAITPPIPMPKHPLATRLKILLPALMLVALASAETSAQAPPPTLDLEPTGVPVDISNTATLTITDNDSELVVNSVGYYADEAATLPIIEGAINTHIYMVIEFNSDVQHVNTVDDVTLQTSERVTGQPGILVRHQSVIPGVIPPIVRIPIRADNTAFPNLVSACRARFAGDTSEYLCQVFLREGSFGTGALRLVVEAGGTSNTAGNTLAADYVDEDEDGGGGVTVVDPQDPPTVLSITHYSDAARSTAAEISDTDTVRGGTIYSVIQFAGLPIASSEFFYQIGPDAADRVRFGDDAPTGDTPPQNGTCALLERGTGLAAANQSFWCRYNLRLSDAGAGDYQVIVGTGTTDTAGEPLADPFPSASVTLDVETGTATLSIAAVDVDEGAGTATVSVTVDDAVTGGFSVDAMTDDGTATAPGDYTAVSGQTLSFTGTAAPETLSFTVTIIDDPLYEGGTSGVPETVAVSLGNLQNNATDVDISSAAATISIRDNDYEVALTMEDVSVSEGVGSTATVIVSVDTRVPGAFSVEASTADGTATASGDYTIVSDQVLSFTGEAGEMQTFSVPIANDSMQEFPETLTVSLSNLQVTTDTATTAGTLRPVSATITIMDDDIDTGDINLHLLFPVTFNGKTYRYLDNNGDGLADAGDLVSHIALDNLLNGGSDTMDTQTTRLGGHNGQDDARAVIVGDMIVILPTLAELKALRSSQPNTSPLNWRRPTNPLEGYWTSTRSTNGHSYYRFSDEVVADRTDIGHNYVAFQVRTLPTFSAGIADQAYTVGQTVALTLPKAGGGVGTLTYTLTRDDGSPVLPLGLTFDDMARTISGASTVVFGGIDGASMRYTATDAIGAVRDIVFVLRVAAAPALVAIAEQTYTATTVVNLTLPVSTTGATPLTYTLTPSASIPAGLTFDAAMRTLTGTPTTATAAGTLTYAVTDANGVAASQTFMVTVNAMLSIANVEVGEGDGTAIVTVSVDIMVPGGFSVDISTMDDTAIADEDYTAVIRQTLAFTGETAETHTVSIAITNDKAVEGPETLTLLLTDLDGTTAPVVIGNPAMVTITDDDTAVLTILSTSSGESTSSLALDIFVSVILGDAVPGGFTVLFETADDTATAGEDYTAVSRILTFEGTADELHRVSIPVLPDDVPERAESFTVSLRDLDNTQADVDISATATPTIRVSDGGIVGFGDAVIADQVYVANTIITPLTLPEPIAADFTGTPFYTLTPASTIPPGLSFDAATHTLSDMPTATTTTPVTLIYTASNSGTSASLTFSITVVAIGVGSVTHYSDAAAATPITDLVSSGEIYSVVVFGANVSNENATDTTARPAIAYTLGNDTPVQFGIVAHDAVLANGNCRAALATDTSRYTCHYSVADSGPNVAANDPGAYTLSVLDVTTDEVSSMALDAYDADAGVTIGVRPELRSVTYYADSEATMELTENAVIGSAVYAVLEFSENMDNINGVAGSLDMDGLPTLGVWTANPIGFNGESLVSHVILAHNARLRHDTCQAESAEVTSRYLCRTNLALAQDYVRFVVKQDARDLAGNTLAMEVQTDNFPLINPLPPEVRSIMHYADSARTKPIRDGDVVSGGDIYSVIQFSGLTVPGSSLEVFYKLGSAMRMPFSINLTTQEDRTCNRPGDGGSNPFLDPQWQCRYSVGAADDGRYQVIVGAGTQDTLGQPLGADSTVDSGVIISALRFAADADIADQTYTAGTAITPLPLPQATGGVAPLTYRLTPTASIPAGLSFDAAAGTLEGRPATSTAAVALTYVVTDANGVTTSQTFLVTVSAVLSIADVVVDEGVGIAIVTVRLDHAVPGGFMVDALLLDVSATAVADYTADVSRTLTFAGTAGEPQTFSVTIVDDALDEDDETVTLSLDNLEGNSVPVDISDTATLTITDNDSGLTVTSVGYFADEAAAITGAATTVITEAAIGTHVYMVIQFSENVQNVNTVDGLNIPSSERRTGQPAIFVRHLGVVPFSSILNSRLPIHAHNTAFQNGVNACRVIPSSGTSAYLCQVFLPPEIVAPGTPLQVVLAAGAASTSAGNTLAVEHVDTGIGVVDTPAAPVPSITHYSDADRSTAISGTVTGGTIYSVIEFAGLIIASQEIFYQIGDAAAERVQFGVHTPGDTPENGTCALIAGDYSMVPANQSFLCRYNTRSGDTGTGDTSTTYHVIVGTGTTDTAGQTAAEFTSSVTLNVTTGTATLSIMDVEVDEDAGTATVSVTVDDAVMSGFSVDAMTVDDAGTATDGEDYTAVSGQTLSFAGTFDGETLSFTVPIIDDALYEGGESGDVKETVVVSLVNPQNATNVDSSNTATIRITDNEYQVALTMEDFSVNENTGTATVSVSLETAVDNPFSVEASTTDGTATAPGDYTAIPSQILSFTGTTASEIQTFSVTIINDSMREFPETLTVSLSNLDVPTDTATTVGTLRPVSATITIMDNDINTRGINLNLIFPVTAEGKTYFYLDQNGNGIADIGDVVTHIALDNLLNNGIDTDVTQDRMHNGQDDARSVIVGDRVVILPTVAELTALRSSQSNTAPLAWPNPSSGGEYWTANLAGTVSHVHSDYSFSNGMDTGLVDSILNYVAFQVRTLPTFSAGIADQTYTVGQPVALTLPDAAGGVGTLSYTLTRDDGAPVLPAGLSFDRVARTINGTPSEPFGDTAGARMRYTATDATGAVRDIVFRLRVAAAPAIGAIADQNYTADIDVNLTLPVTGGIAPLTYTLTPTASIPAGLSFDGARTLAGTPTTATAAVALTYVVTDANGVAASQTFMVTVSAVLSITDVEVGEGDGPATVTVRLEHDVPGGFMVEAFLLGVSATAGADYIADVSRTLTFDGAAGDQTFSVTIVDDALDEDDSETVTLSLDNLEGTGVPVDISDTATLTITDNDSGLTVTSVGYFADASEALTISQAAIGSSIYIVVEFSENVEQVNTVFNEGVIGRPTIRVRSYRLGFGAGIVDERIPIRADNAAFPNEANACRTQVAGDTSAYLCQVFLHPVLTGTDAPLQVVLTAGAASTSAGNTLAVEHVDTGIAVVDTPAAPAVMSITHYSDADIETATEISGTVTGGTIYSVIQFTGLPLVSPEIFYQIGTAARVQFGGHPSGDTPENGTCALLDSGTGLALANQSFLCRYNTRTADTGTTYQVIVGTGTTDTARQPLDPEFASSVMLDVTTGTATLSIADVEVNEGAGTATVSVTVDDAVTGGFSVDAMTADSTGTATAGEDYTAVTQTLSFAGTFAGETLSFTVTIIDDALYEGGESGDLKETVAVSLGTPVGNTEGTAVSVDSSATATISITDNEYLVVLTMEDFSVNENAGMATVSVSLETAVPDAFSVVASTEDGTGIGIATADEDYTAISGQILSFAGTFAGERQTFSVTIPPGDTTPEFPETLTVSLSNLDVPTDTATRVGMLRPVSATITIMDDDIDTGDINLNLLFPVTVEGKTYFYLDQNGNGRADVEDIVTHIALNRLLNGGSATEATQDGVHNGQDDARSVIVGDTTLILPTVEELTMLRSLQSNTAPAHWQNPSLGGEYWTANVNMDLTDSFGAPQFFFDYGFSDGMATEVNRLNFNYVAFQVRTLPTFSAGIATPQTYTVGQTVTLPLPDAAGGVGTLSYTLTRDDGSPRLPAGLSFDPVARTISGMPGEPFGDTAGARLRYTATDTTGAVRDILFVLRVAAAPALVAIDDQNYTANTAVNLTLPAATGGIAPLTYTLTPTASLPTDLVFDAAELTLKGIPPATATDAVTLTYTVTDANGFTAEQTFTLEVFSAPTIADTVPDQIYTVGQPVALMLPEATAGAPLLTYTLTRIDGGTPLLPDGLTFDATARTISDAPKATFSASAGVGVGLLYTVTDTNGVVASTDFTLLVNAAVTFNTSVIPAPDSAYTYPLNTAITTLTLPPATGGTGVLTYTLTPTDSIPGELTFDAGALTLAGMPTMVTAAVALTYAATDANDVAATLTFTVAVVDRPAVTITDSIATDTANSADGDVIFTFMFTEEVSGFDVSGISLTGGTASGPLNGTAPGATYTLAVTPAPDTNDGIISVAVMENEAIGETTNTGNIATTTPATQKYDTLAPAMPSIDAITGDNVINDTERVAGVPVTGDVERGANVALCFNDGTGTIADCTGGVAATDAPENTAWSYDLTTDNINTLGEGAHVARAVATDAAGNPGPAASQPFTVDITAPDAPTFNLPAAGDIINIAERDTGVTIGGDVRDPGVSVSVCLGAASLTDAPCTGGTTVTITDGVTDTTWRYTLSVAEVNAMGQGDEILLATTIDPAGNRSALGSTTINVDTTVPVFTSGLTGAVAVGATSATVTAYDATARDNNGGDDDGITYTLGGAHAGLFSIVADTGIVTYNDDQNVEAIHTIVITATDTAGNTAERIVTISALNAPAVDITSSTPLMDYANGVITFTISFTEAVTGFEPTGDVSVAGGMGEAITPTPDAATTYETTDTFTLPVTPGTDNDGVLTVTVRANAVMGTVTLTGNPETSVTRQYDTVAPIITGGATATAMFIVNDPVATEVYNADATDDGGTDDDGITYSLSGANAGLFTIHPATGSVTYQTSPTDAAVHTIVITATDKGGNTDTIMVTVTAVLSDNAALSALTVTTTGDAVVPLSPAFATATSAYTATVRQEVTSVTITLPTAHAGATAGIAGTAADGTTALNVTGSTVTGLTEGISPNTNTILVTVTAADMVTMNIYTITLTRAPLLTFGTGVTIDDQTYNIGETIAALTLPVATGGLGTLSYTLTPPANIPADLVFASASRILSGTPSVLDTQPLTYTVTDGATPPVSTTLTFNVMIVRGITVTPGSTADIPLDLDGDMAANDPEDGILTLPPGHTVTEAIIGVPPETAVANPPAGVIFSLTTDIMLDMALTLPATVCMPTTGVPPGREPVLYHYFAGTWNEIGRDTATRAGYVCGETLTFSPFAVGYAQLRARLTTISQTLLPEVARAITDSTVNAITRRIAQSSAGAVREIIYIPHAATGHEQGSFTLGGQTTLAGILTTGGQALADGTLDLYDIVSRSDFVLPINPANGLAQHLTLWGGADYRGLNGTGGATDWDGGLFSMRLGADARVRHNLLAGAALTWTDGDFDYGALTDDPTDRGGDYALELTSLTPYAGWAVLPAGRLDLWATAGYGWGEVTLNDSVVEPVQTSDATTVMVGGGISGQLLKTNASQLRIHGEVMQTSMDLEGHDRIEALTVSARRVRVNLEGKHDQALPYGGRLGTTLEMGIRHDGGDGRTGTGVEMGGGLSYQHPVQGFTLSSQSRVLLGHTGGYEDWGIGGAFSVAPGKGGRGLALRLAPTYGQTATRTAQLWDQNAADLTGTDAAAMGRRMDAEIGYGLAIADGQSLLTPYGKLTWGAGTRDYRLGSRLALPLGLTMSLEGVRGETVGAPPAHRLQWQTAWRWLTASMESSRQERRLQLKAEWQW